MRAGEQVGKTKQADPAGPPPGGGAGLDRLLNASDQPSGAEARKIETCGSGLDRRTLDPSRSGFSSVIGCIATSGTRAKGQDQGQEARPEPA